MYKLCLLAFVIAAVGAQHYGHEGGHHHVDYYAEPHYYFEYDVKDPHTGDFKSHKEQRKGDHTEGVYSLHEPDGSKRVVEYVVEGKKGGFVPKVHRGPGKLVDHKHGHVGHVNANYNFHQGEVHEVQYQSGGHGGHQGGFGGNQGGHGGFGGNQGGYGGHGGFGGNQGGHGGFGGNQGGYGGHGGFGGNQGGHQGGFGGNQGGHGGFGGNQGGHGGFGGSQGGFGGHGEY